MHLIILLGLFISSVGFSMTCALGQCAGCPGPCQNVQVTSGFNSITITFDAPSDTGDSPIEEYVVEISSSETDQWGDDPYEDYNSFDEPAYLTIEDLPEDVEFTVTVYAVNSFGPGQAVTKMVTPSAGMSLEGLAIDEFTGWLIFMFIVVGLSALLQGVSMKRKAK